MNGFEAKYPGTCPVCEDDIYVGQMIVSQVGIGYIHEGCTEDLRIATISSEREPAVTTQTLPRGKTAKDRCSTCFQIPSSNGTCGCY